MLQAIVLTTVTPLVAKNEEEHTSKGCSLPSMAVVLSRSVMRPESVAVTPYKLSPA